MHEPKTEEEKKIKFLINVAKVHCDVQTDNFNQIIIYTGAYLDEDGLIVFNDEDEFDF